MFNCLGEPFFRFLQIRIQYKSGNYWLKNSNSAGLQSRFVISATGISRDKTMNDELIYTHNVGYRLKLVDKNQKC